jgi:hypothetical protein
VQLRPKFPVLSCVLAGLAIAASATSPVSRGDDYERAVRMDVDRRADPEAFAMRAGVDRDELRGRYGASGLIRCGDAVGSGQLTLRNDLITTAAHVLFDKSGKLRSATCSFEPLFAQGLKVDLDIHTIQTGSSIPYAEPATRDWAIVRLTAPVERAQPYSLGGANLGALPIFMCAGGNGGGDTWGAERCSTREVTKVADDGIREITIDCSADHGASGAALVSEGNDMIAIYVGYRSTAPKAARPYSPTHYNFAITVEGPFRQALVAMASSPAEELLSH